MVSSIFFRSLIPFLIAVSLVDAAITLKLKKHHGNARSHVERSRNIEARSVDDNLRAPWEIGGEERRRQPERLRSRIPIHERQEEANDWAVFIDLLSSLESPEASPESTESSTSGSASSPTAASPEATGDPTSPLSQVGPGELTAASDLHPAATDLTAAASGESGANPSIVETPTYTIDTWPYSSPTDTPYTPTWDSMTTPSATPSEYSASSPAPSGYPSESSTGSPSQYAAGTPFDDDDGATVLLENPHSIAYTIQVEVAGQVLDLLVRLPVSTCRRDDVLRSHTADTDTDAETILG